MIMVVVLRLHPVGLRRALDHLHGGGLHRHWTSGAVS